MASPLDALRVRTDFTQQFENPVFKRVTDAYIGQEMKAAASPGRSTAIAGYSFDVLRNAMSVAETFYVSPDMAAFAQMAAEDFPIDEEVRIDDLPSQAGFMYLPSRFRFLEMRGRLQVVHAIVWLNTKVWLVTDRQDPEDEISQRLRDEMGQGIINQAGRYDLNGLVQFDYDRPMPSLIMFDKGILPPEAKVNITEKNGSMQIQTDHYIPLDQGVAHSQVDPTLRFLLAVWRLMQQTLASVTEEVIPRNVRRQAERLNIPTKVTVIALRRRKHTGEGDGTPLAYRTIVRGHWRRAWCGPKGQKYQRAVYIHPFWRGPEDAPIIIRERINALIR